MLHTLGKNLQTYHYAPVHFSCSRVIKYFCVACRTGLEEIYFCLRKDYKWKKWKKPIKPMSGATAEWTKFKTYLFMSIKLSALFPMATVLIVYLVEQMLPKSCRKVFLGPSNRLCIDQTSIGF